MQTIEGTLGSCGCCDATGCCGCSCESLIVTITNFKYLGTIIGAGPVSIVYTNNHDAVDGNNCTFEQPVTDGAHIVPVSVTIGGTPYTEVSIAFGRVGCRGFDTFYAYYFTGFGMPGSISGLGVGATNLSDVATGDPMTGTCDPFSVTMFVDLTTIYGAGSGFTLTFSCGDP